MVKQRLKVGTTPVWGEDGEAAFLYVTGMAIDADGAPHAYNPTDTGLDYLANAGRPGNWWGIVTDTGRSDGKPVIQGASDPAPGYYVSATSLEDTRYTRIQQRRYVDAETIPYIVLPSEVLRATGMRLGDFAWVRHTTSDKSCFALFADGGPAGKIGEGSIALAKALGINPSPKRGGISSPLVSYLAFPGSGTRVPVPVADINRLGAAALAKFGGSTRYKAWMSAIGRPLTTARRSDVRKRGPVVRPLLSDLEPA